MGIYDRDYSREGSEEYTPTGVMGGITPVVKWLLIVNFIVFVANELAFKPIQSLGGITLLDKYWGGAKRF